MPKRYILVFTNKSCFYRAHYESHTRVTSSPSPFILYPPSIPYTINSLKGCVRITCIGNNSLQWLVLYLYSRCIYKIQKFQKLLKQQEIFTSIRFNKFILHNFNWIIKTFWRQCWNTTRDQRGKKVWTVTSTYVV